MTYSEPKYKLDRLERNRRIEKIREYYKNERISRSNEQSIREMEIMLKYIKTEKVDLKNFSIDPHCNMSIDYTELSIPKGQDISSQQERALIKYIDRLHQKELEYRNEILRLKEFNAHHKIKQTRFKNATATLDEFEKEVIELLCYENKSIVYIGNTLFSGVTKTAYLNIDRTLTLFENYL